MDRILLISIGVTILAVGLVFVYFRNKVSGIEKKVELMFNLIQNYEGSQNMMQNSINTQLQEPVYENNYNNGQSLQTDLIEVSDDDSDEVSDNESEDDSDDEETLSFATTEVHLDENDIKTLDLDNSENNDNNDNNDNKYNKDEDSLDEIDDSEEEPDIEEIDTENMIELTETDYKKKTVVELKKLAEEKGLQNYKSLKKAPLIQLLMSQ